MVNYWKIVNDVIHKADILLLVIDARFPELTRNLEIEKKTQERSKKLLYVLNKSDLVTSDELKPLKDMFKPCVFVSSTKKFGGTILFKKIMRLSHGKPCSVGVLGYPNVGKSSVINLLKGRKSASTSSQSGHTKGIQFVKAKGKLKLIDTPGVLEFREKDLLKQITIGAYNPQHVKEPDYYAILLVEKYSKLFEKYYGINYTDALDFLQKVTLNRKVLKKGGKPDISRFSRQLLYDWQKGRIHKHFLE